MSPLCYFCPIKLFHITKTLHSEIRTCFLGEMRGRGEFNSLSQKYVIFIRCRSISNSSLGKRQYLRKRYRALNYWCSFYCFSDLQDFKLEKLTPGFNLSSVRVFWFLIAYGLLGTVMCLHAYVSSVKSHGCCVVLIDLRHAPFCACASQEIRSRRKAVMLSCHHICLQSTACPPLQLCAITQRSAHCRSTGSGEPSTREFSHGGQKWLRGLCWFPSSQNHPYSKCRLMTDAGA